SKCIYRTPINFGEVHNMYSSRRKHSALRGLLTRLTAQATFPCMAFITFTQQELETIRNPFQSDQTIIGFEDDPTCTGEKCGERIFLTEEDQEKYGRPTVQEPLGRHCHIIVIGQNP